MNHFDEPESLEKMEELMKAVAAFVMTDAFEAFLKKPELGLGAAIVMTELTLRWPVLLEMGDDWVEMFEAVMALGIVCWEDQPLKAPR